MARIDETKLRARFEKAIADHDQDWETFFLARLLDLAFTYLPEDAPDSEKELCRVTMPPAPFLENPNGVLHGGAIATLMDVSMGHLVAKVAGPGATIEVKVQYLRPIGGGTLTAEGRFTRRGRRVSFMESRLYDAKNRLAAHATATWKMPEP